MREVTASERSRRMRSDQNTSGLGMGIAGDLSES